MMFIADAMLGTLAKRLRLLGFDVLYDPAYADNEVLRLSLEQGRVILTRDTGLASRPLASNRVLIAGDHLDEQLRQVLSLYPPPDGGALTRCSVCNGALVPLDRNDARDLLPDHVFRTVRDFFTCQGCGRTYWEGSHVKQMTEARTGKRPADRGE